MKKQSNKGFARSDRIAAKVQSLVAEVLRDDYPEINITLTGSESHGGLQFVRIYYQGDKSIQSKLDDIKPQVRKELSARIDQKYTPDIRFVYDDTLEKSDRIKKLLNNLEI